MDKEKIKALGPVGVLMGGCSSEREISLKSGRAVLTALAGAGVDAREICIDSEDADVNTQALQRSGIRVAFIAMHGRYGEDGGIQAVLDSLAIPYPGSGALASRMAMNKIATQTALKQAGLPVADFCVLEQGQQDFRARIQDFFGGDAVVVKPAAEGSSIGIRVVRDYASLDDAVRQAFQYGGQVMVERFVHGRELTVGLLGEQALPVVEIRAPYGFFDFEAKYKKGATEYIVPAPLETGVAERASAISLAVFRTTGCRDFARVDLLLSEAGDLYILEINTIPGFTGTSLLPMAAACAGYDFTQLCLKLLSLAAGRSLVTGTFLSS